jgi:hypothetical protein
MALDKLIPVIITAALLLIPLVPAAILYLMLSPRRTASKTVTGALTASADTASGELETESSSFGKLKFRFNVIGSTATYVVLLIAACWIYSSAEARRAEDARAIAESMRDQQAWFVRVPVNLKSADGKPIVADRGQLQQVRVELEPSSTFASSNTLEFWVLPSKGAFPTARLSIPTLSELPTILDLNDPNRVDARHAERLLRGIEPVWLQLGAPYVGGQ